METSRGPLTPHNRIRFGAAYYHEYHRPGEAPTAERLAQDLDRMTQAGVSLIRVGESVWSTWEPEEGHFDLDWLQPVLDGAAARGIDVILGTPTYAVPPWMARLHPEIAGDVATGQPLTWGARQEMDFTHPAFRFYADRIVRMVVGRYADHPAVVGFQVDNEPGLRLLYNRGIFERFVDHLRGAYGDVERLNQEWGLVYWSHRLATWADLWVPDNNLQPQYDLAWRRFQAQLVTEFISEQADIVRGLVRSDHPEKFVTTCISYDQLGVDDVGLGGALDVASGNVYYTLQDGLAHPSTAPMSPTWIVEGTWAVYQLADLAYSSRQEPFFVTETNAESIGHGWINTPPYAGQLRQIAWALVSRGARAIEYWHWNTLHYGAETWWGGVLPHDGKPGRIYDDVAALGREFAAAGPAVADLTPDADVALLYSSDSKWALASPTQTFLPDPAGNPDPDSYRRMLLPFYRGAFDAGLQVNTVRPEQLFGEAAPGGQRSGGMDPAGFAARRPVLLVPAYYAACDADLVWMNDYVHAGGHLILGPRTGYGDHEGRARVDVKPSRLSGIAGVAYQEAANLTEPVPVTAGASADGRPLALPAGATATLWSDYLEVGDAHVLATYDHPHLSQWPAAVTKSVGAGRITTIGTVPDQGFAHALLQWAIPTPVVAWPGIPEDVRLTSARRENGTRILFVHHWGWGETRTVTPVRLTDVLDPRTILEPGTELELGPWDVRIFHEA